MKIRKGFLLREIAGSWVVVPIGERVVEFNGLMTLSESSALLWRKLETGAEIEALVEVLLAEYEVDKVTARADVQEFIKAIDKIGLLENS